MKKHMSCASCDKYLDIFENLTAQNIGDLNDLTSLDVQFRDPFNDLVGRAAFIRVMEKLLDDVTQPRFQILKRFCDEDCCLVLWRFSGTISGLRNKKFEFDGVSQLRFDASGQVNSHIDYWDAASHFYEQIPLVGSLIRLIKQKLTIKPSETGQTDR